MSGRLLLRMPAWLHRTLAERAAHERVSLNTLIVSLLAAEARRLSERRAA